MSGDSSGRRTALRLEEALRVVAAEAPRLPEETVALVEALGRVLTRGLLARIDQPPFDKSAMDGFAHGSSLPAPRGPWRVVGTAAAKPVTAPPTPLGPGDCLRIMTGAMVPPGTVAVQRVEWTEALPGSAVGTGVAGTELVRFTREEKSDNIIRRGENQRAGEPLLGPRVLRAQDLGILASSGWERISVSRRPRVAVISTGDELAATGSSLGLGVIFDSNGPQLVAQALSLGCEARFLGIVRDDEEALTTSFEEALAVWDLLLVSGGVSMGEFDHVPTALARAGVEMVFHGLAMKPGKPVFFGKTRTGAAVFGLPGNPVSTFVAFEILVRTHLAARVGLSLESRSIGARLASPLSRRDCDRCEFLPARLEQGSEGLPQVRPLRYGGSSMLSALAEADCLVVMDVGIDRLDQGSIVNARLVRP